MNNHGLNRRAWAIAAAAFAIFPLAAHAQLVPWRVFSDPDSTSVCDVVNATNAELVVLIDSRRLVIVTGTDTELVNTEVLNSGEVLIDGDSFGFIEFATDAEGFRTLWWVSLTGRAIEVDGFTGAPSVSDLLPAGFANIPCDACPFWDDGSICTCVVDSECDDFDECTIDQCDVLGGCSHFELLCETGDRCTEAFCDPVEGCVVADVVCDDNDPCTEDLCDSQLGCVVIDEDCDDNNECTDDFCDEEGCFHVEHTDRCNDGDPCTSNDRCSSGVCSGTTISNCGNGGGGGGPVFVICGNSAGMAMMLTFSGLVATGALRRRRSMIQLMNDGEIR